MKYDLEERLIKFAAAVLDLVELLPGRGASVHLGNQLARSGTAPALVYGEAQGAESRNDFVHKMRIGLKELRETSICLRIIATKNYIPQTDKLHATLRENIELIAIFVKSIKTASSNDLRS
jgi:four helix bundle protein